MKSLGKYLGELRLNTVFIKKNLGIALIWLGYIFIFAKYAFITVVFISGLISMLFPIRVSKIWFIVPISKEQKINIINRCIGFRTFVFITIEVIATAIVIYTKNYSNYYVLAYNFAFCFLAVIIMPYLNLDVTKQFNNFKKSRIFGTIAHVLELVMIIILSVILEKSRVLGDMNEISSNPPSFSIFWIVFMTVFLIVAITFTIICFVKYRENQLEFYLKADIWLGNQEKSK